MPDRRIVRYFPGGKTVVLGIKPADATTNFTYTPGRGINAITRLPRGLCSVLSQPKNAKELIPFNSCNPCPICIYHDAGGAGDEFMYIFDGNGDGEPLDSQIGGSNLCD
jgi:hypothetical protein